MSIKVPCKDCLERKLNCHSHCQLYKDFRDAMDKANELRRLDLIGYSAEESRMAKDRLISRYIGKVRGY